jgi:hypothetical protein
MGSFFRLVLVSFFLVVLLTGCERDITFNLDTVESKLVVEASIENGEPPLVILSKSLPFFDTIRTSQLATSFVRDAKVAIVHNGITYPLKGYTSFLAGIPVGYHYTVDSLQPALFLRGALQQRYTLTIQWQGKFYQAQTTIPSLTRRIDSIFWRPAPPDNPPNKAALYVRATDAPGFGDYIRYYTRQNNGPFLPGLNSVYDDQVIDGTSYEVQVERGIVRNGQPEEGYNFFDRGDTVTLKLCNIDKATFDFWRTVEFNYASIGNPFSSPTKVLGNVSGNALGYFGGYAAQYRTIIIPR